MTDTVDGFYKKTPTPVKFALRSFLSFTIEPMTDDRELQELVREFEQGGLQNLFIHPPAPVPYEETPQHHLNQCRHDLPGRNLNQKYALSGTKTDTSNQGKHQRIPR